MRYLARRVVRSALQNVLDRYDDNDFILPLPLLSDARLFGETCGSDGLRIQLSGVFQSDNQMRAVLAESAVSRILRAYANVGARIILYIVRIIFSLYISRTKRDSHP